MVLLAAEGFKKRRLHHAQVGSEFGDLVLVEHEVNDVRAASVNRKAKGTLGVCPSDGDLRVRGHASLIAQTGTIPDPEQKVGRPLLPPRLPIALDRFRCALLISIHCWAPSLLCRSAPSPNPSPCWRAVTRASFSCLGGCSDAACASIASPMASISGDGDGGRARRSAASVLHVQQMKAERAALATRPTWASPQNEQHVSVASTSSAAKTSASASAFAAIFASMRSTGGLVGCARASMTGYTGGILRLLEPEPRSRRISFSMSARCISGQMTPVSISRSRSATESVAI